MLRVIPAVYSEVIDALPHGAMGLCRADMSNPQSRFIAATGGAIWSHALTIATADCPEPEVIETHQRSGPVVLPLEQYVADNSGRIDVFLVDAKRWPEWDADLCVSVGRDLCEKWPGRYGWYSFWRIWFTHTHLGRWLLTPKGDDMANGSHPPVCSEMRSIQDQVAGVDPVPNLENWRVTPSHLGNSLLYAYLFTLFSTTNEAEKFFAENYQ